jgi:hypothetical protein
MTPSFTKAQFRQQLKLVVDRDERGSFRAHVENQNGKSVFEFSNEDPDTGWPTDEGLWLINDGFMKHGRDTKGLLTYLQSIGVAKAGASLEVGG